MYGDAQRALFTQLAAHPDVQAMRKSTAETSSKWSLRRPGYPYTPKPNQPYIETTFLTPARVRSSYGFGRTSTMRGTYQISLFHPALGKDGDGAGYQALADMADSIANWFYPTHRRGAVYTFNTTTVEIHDLPIPGPLFEGEAHVMQPLDVIYWFDDNPA